VTWRIIQIIYPSGDRDLWPFDLGTSVQCHPWHGQRLLPANFGASATFLCRVVGKHASDWRHDVITLTFDLWGHRTCLWCGSSYSICIPSLKFIRFLFPVWNSYVFCFRRYGLFYVTALNGLVTLTFDLWGDADHTPSMYGTKFKVHRPSRSEDMAHFLSQHSSA